MQIKIEELKELGIINLKQTLNDTKFIDEPDLLKFDIDFEFEYVPGDIVLVKGNIKVELDKVCEKCLEKFVCKLDIPFYQEYVMEDFDDPSILDFTNDLKEEYWLNIPITYRCSENCKGLCPICGINLNKKKCNCKQDLPESDNNPFSALKNLKNKIKR